MKKRVYLVDIDGTITKQDVKNEDSHLYPDVTPFEGSKEELNKLYDEGNKIVFFTARQGKDKDVTIEWLNKHGFKFHDIIMDKPRIYGYDEYVWIDNHPTRGITFTGTWSPIVELKNQEVETLLNFKK